MAKHNERPEPGELSEEDLSKIESLRQSDYFSYLKALRQPLIGKIVVNSLAGNSGFILFFSDQHWAISYLTQGRLECLVGTDDITEAESVLIHSPEYGDGLEPIFEDRPYADEPCDISTEIAKAHGKPITGLAIGENTFNFCFPEGKELETMIVRDQTGRDALRVFWEQW